MRSVESEGGTIDEAIERALAALGAERDQVEIEILENAQPGVFGIGRKKARVRARIRAPLHVRLAMSETAPEPPPPAPQVPPPAVSGGVSASHPGSAEPPEVPPSSVLGGILRHMGMRATVVERAGPEGERVLDVQGVDAAAIVGRQGEVLDALEHVVNLIAERGGAGRERCVLDANGHRAKRRASLEESARASAERARQRRKPVTLDSLGPSDRRVVQEALKAVPGVAVRTTGQGLYRRLVIIPEGARRGGGKAKR